MARLASFASTSASNAASTIAAAPDLPIGALVASGWVEPGFADGLDYGEFWRVPMNAGDKLTLDATETGCDEGAALGFEIFAPSVTDFTVRNANAGASGGADGHGEFTFVAPSSGPWILFVNGCDSTSYDVLASMKERTLISIQAPHLGQPHARIVIRGQIASPSNGRVVLRLLTHQRWVLVATTTISLDGRFRFVVRAPGPGSYRYQVLYRGDSSHVASSRVVTVASR
jgi:hypothetical protein